jgi:hypothetical protein
VLAVAGLLFAACGAPPHLEQTPTIPSFDEEFLSPLIDGEEFTVPAGQALVMYADHLPQAGGSGDEAVSNAELETQLKSLAYSPSFKTIPAVWGLSNHCTYAIYVDVYYIGALHITVVDADKAHQIVEKWSADNRTANHYISENEIPCLAA